MEEFYHCSDADEGNFMLLDWCLGSREWVTIFFGRNERGHEGGEETRCSQIRRANGFILVGELEPVQSSDVTTCKDHLPVAVSWPSESLNSQGVLNLPHYSRSMR